MYLCAGDLRKTPVALHGDVTVFTGRFHFGGKRIITISETVGKFLKMSNNGAPTSATWPKRPYDVCNAFSGCSMRPRGNTCHLKPLCVYCKAIIETRFQNPVPTLLQKVTLRGAQISGRK